MDQLFVALHSLKSLRLNVGQIFETLGGGIRVESGEEQGENKFLHDLQDLLAKTNINLRFVYTTRLFSFDDCC